MPSAPFLALITPIGGDSGGGQPVYPSHPIALPGDPGWGQIPGFTPGTPPPRPHPQPPLVIWGPPGPWPTPPIYFPPPGGGGGGGNYPSHPIVYPPEIWPPLPGGRPPGGGAQPPLVIWGPPGPWPTPPISGGFPGAPGGGGGSGGSPIPPPGGGTPPNYPGQLPSSGQNWHWAYVPGVGWVWAYHPGGAPPTTPETPPPVVDNTLPEPQ